MMNTTNWIGLVAGIFTAFSMVPQIFKTLKKKQASDISYGMISVLMAGLACWIVYGIRRNDLPIIVTNSFSFLVNVVLLILAIKYNRDYGKQ